MANQPDKVQDRPRHCVSDGPALKVSPGQRIRPKNFARLDDRVIPSSYWYLTASLVVAAFVLGLFLGRFVIG
jgi:hypothetical protein